MGTTESKDSERNQEGDQTDDLSFSTRTKFKKGTLVTVNEKAEFQKLEDNPIILKLQQIPKFAPIINDRGGFWSKEPQLESKLPAEPLMGIAQAFHQRTKTETTTIIAEQARLSKRVTDVNQAIQSISKTLVAREKKFAKNLDNFAKVSELSLGLLKCQTLLNDSINTVNLLNGILPFEERLEPFEPWEEESILR